MTGIRHSAGTVLLALTISPCVAQKGDYTRELDLARKAGLPTRPADLKRPSIPDSRNAAVIYRKLSAVLNPKGKEGPDVDAMALLTRTPPTAAQIARARRLLAANAELLRSIHDAASRPDCNFGRDWSLGPALPFPEYAHMRSAARWLSAESGDLLLRGKPVDAVHNLALGFRIARHAESDSTLIAHLVAVAVDAITFRGLETIIDRTSGNPTVVAAMEAEIESKWSPLSLAHALRGELVMAEVSIDLVRSGGLAALRQLTDGAEPSAAERKHTPTAAELQRLQPLLDANGAHICRHIRTLYAVADKPFPECQHVADVLARELSHANDPTWILAVTILPAYEQIPSRRAYDEAHASVLRCAASLLLYRNAHHALPDRLDQSISPVPVDSFDLRPLRYRRQGNGFVVYSIGQTGKFDGRAKDAKQYSKEAVFAWPAPSFFSKPSSP